MNVRLEGAFLEFYWFLLNLLKPNFPFCLVSIINQIFDHFLCWSRLHPFWILWCDELRAKCTEFLFFKLLYKLSLFLCILLSFMKHEQLFMLFKSILLSWRLKLILYLLLLVPVDSIALIFDVNRIIFTRYRRYWV